MLKITILKQKLFNCRCAANYIYLNYNLRNEQLQQLISIVDIEGHSNIYANIHTHAHSHRLEMLIHVCTHTTKVDVRCLPQSFSTSESTCSCPVWFFGNSHTFLTGFYTGAGGLMSDPFLCITSTLWIESSPILLL